jgi:hypothetical protein
MQKECKLGYENLELEDWTVKIKTGKFAILICCWRWKAAAEALKMLFAQSSHLQRSLSLFLSRSLQSAHLENLVFKQEKDALPMGPVSSWRNKTLKGPKRLSSSPASQINTRTICYFTQVPESKTGQLPSLLKDLGFVMVLHYLPFKQVSFYFTPQDQTGVFLFYSPRSNRCPFVLIPRIRK